MIRRTSKYLVLASLAGFAAHASAGTAAVTPALAACSKALVQTLANAETLPAYTVKAPSVFVSDLTDPNAFTVYARHARTKALLAKASCKATPSGEILSFKSIPLKS
jgi:beta-lactamase class A